MQLTVKEISLLVQGKTRGDENNIIRGAASLEEATIEEVSFLKEKTNASSTSFLLSKAGAIFVHFGVEAPGKTIIEVPHPLAAFAIVLSRIYDEKRYRMSGVHPTAYVSEKAHLGKNVTVGPFCVVEDGSEVGDGTQIVAFGYIGPRVKVGKNTILYPHVTLREEVIIGNRCILHAGCVIGSDGYGFYFDKGRHNKIPQVGTVVIEDDVEIGSCSTVDRATTGRTLIKNGTKIDNLVQIAHNVEIGEHCLLVSQSGVAGSSKLGKGVVIAGQVGVSDHVTLADGTQVGAQSGVKDNTTPGEIIWGTPAQPIQERMKQLVLIRRLPEIIKELKRLKEKLKNS